MMPNVVLECWRVPADNTAYKATDLITDEFVCQLTSGVTGASRIVSRSYSNIADELEVFVSTLGITRDDTVLCPAPLFHAYGLFSGLLPCLYTGARFVFLQRFFPSDITALSDRYRPTILIGVPFMYELLTRAHNSDRLNFDSYRLFLSAGAKPQASLIHDVERIFGKPLSQIYSSTETGIISVNLPCREGFDAASSGQPLASISHHCGW
jgi:long-chain acyl-CoA synthetase